MRLSQNEITDVDNNNKVYRVWSLKIKEKNSNNRNLHNEDCLYCALHSSTNKSKDKKKRPVKTSSTSTSKIYQFVLMIF